MSLSEAGICNLALSHLGHDKQITALTDNTTAARACNTWYEQCRNEVLRAKPWPFATTLADLALVADFTDDTDPLYDANAEWTYAYAVPSDSLRVLRLPYGSSRNASPETTAKYRIKRQSTGGQLIYTDQDDATAEYIITVTDPGEFPSDFVAALSHLIASRICPLVVSEGHAEKRHEQYGLYLQTLGVASAAAANEETPDLPPDCTYLSTRG
jgi:hypothetical protein